MKVATSYQYLLIRLLMNGFLLALLSVLMNAVSGCSSSTSMAKVFGSVDFLSARSYETSPEFRNFISYYNQYALKNRTRTQQIKHFSDAFNRVRNEYVNNTDDRVLLEAAISGITDLKGKSGSLSPKVLTEAALDSLMAALDPHSTYLNPEEFRESRVVTRGEFGGLGIEINMDRESKTIRVIAPIEDTPASRAGIKPGDLITHVDGEPIRGKSLASAVKLLRGRANSSVKLTIWREGSGEFNVTIVRAIIQIQPVKWEVLGNVGVIRVTHFISKSEEALQDALSLLINQIGYRLEGLVLDLRNNPGGLLNQSIAVTDIFLKHGEIVSVRNRAGSIRGYNAEPDDLLNGVPIVVLINEGSASASEIVAGALQDHGRATVMGARSFGKGSVQTISPLNWDGALRLTTALYYLPSGRTIQGTGVTPDVAIVGSNKNTNLPGETNLQNSLVVRSQNNFRTSRLNILENDCPSSGGDKKDKVLGCAVMYLKAGSENDFKLLMERRRGVAD